MTDKPKILCFAGSLRQDSLNKKLARLARDLAAAAGAEATFIDLKEYPMPIYDEDIEQASGLPENASKLKELMKSNHAFLIACPEYNSSITAALKNAIDWASRPAPGEKPLECFTGKVAGLMAASPGGLGGLRGLVVVRSLLSNIGVIVVPEQHAIPKATEAFDGDGKFTDEKDKKSVDKVAKSVVAIVRGQLALKN
jgi:chromate reductase, NAD(P)H dehydrogenase (quinone)